MFDSVDYFESRGVACWTSGKNVTAGWVNIQCPFCGLDKSNHCGISPDNFFNCYVCGETGHVTKLIRQMEKCSWLRAQRIFDSFQQGYHFIEKITEKRERTFLPKECLSKFPRNYLNYLKKRRFVPNYLITKYNLKCCANVGKYKFRIIIPFYFNNQLITFTSLDVTDRQKIKYKHQKIDEAVISVKNTLYNIDSVTDKMILVEGITDVWRVGDCCCAVMGKQITEAQINLIVRKNVKQVLVMFDSDAIEQTKKVANKLYGVIPFVEYVELFDGDPDDFTKDCIAEVRKFLK